MYQTKGAAQDIFIKLPNMALPPPTDKTVEK